MRELLEVARASLACGVRSGAPLAVEPRDYAEPLRALRASFVTLEREGALRGCIGSLEPRRPLVVDVAENAFAAGFRDPRFSPLRAEELGELEVRLSLLGALEPLEVSSETELLGRLRPGVDGLVIAEGSRRGTFLPGVWDAFAEPDAFLRALKRKAGLEEAHWSCELRVWRYTVEELA